MIEKTVELFGEYAAQYGYLIVFLVSLLENSIFLGALVPGEVAAILAGFYAGQGVLSWPVVIILILVGSVIGDNIGFYLGRIKGKKWLNKIGHYFGYREEKIERAEGFWLEHGGNAVFFARFITVARTFVPFLAGASKLKHKDFFYYDLAGAAIHAIVMVGLGYFFGENWETLTHTFGIIGVIMLIIFVAVVYNYLIKKGIAKIED